MAGAPENNTNSSKDNRLWRNTINRAIAQGDPDRLRRIADKLLSEAENGEAWAIKELGPITGEDGGNLVIEVVKFANTLTE